MNAEQLKVKAFLLQSAADAIKRNGYYKIATCNDRRWNIDQHLMMQALYRNGVNGRVITYEVNHGVTDWTIVSA